MRHVAINHHYVGMPVFPHAGIHGLDTGEFRKNLEQIQRRYTPVSLAEVVQAAKKGRDLPGDTCMITFDDGMRCQYEKAVPVLDDLGIPSALFIMAGPYMHRRVPLVHKVHWIRANLGDNEVLDCLREAHSSKMLSRGLDGVDLLEASKLNPYDNETASKVKYFLSRVASPEIADQMMDRCMARLGGTWEEFLSDFFMTRDMIKDLAGRGMIGSHAVSHVPLSKLSLRKLRNEIGESKAFLEDLCGTDIQAMSYPYGIADAVDRRVAEMTAKAGYSVAYTMERAYNPDWKDPLLLARIDIRDLPKSHELRPRSRYK